MTEKLEQDLQSLRIDRGRKAGFGAGRGRAFVILLILLALAVIALVAFVPERLGLSGLTGKAHEVEVALVERRAQDVADVALTASGYVIPRHRVEVSSKMSGRVLELLVERGDIVKVGQVLARLDNEEIKAQLDQARATRQATAARLEEALAGSRPQEVERAQAALAEAEANLSSARINLERAQTLHQKGVLAKQGLDDARNAHDVAAAQVTVARKNLELTKLGPRAEQVELARAQLAEADASILLWEAQLENTIIRAPVAGTVLERLIEKGEMVTTGYVSGRGAKSALVSIADLNDLEVELDINEGDIRRVHVGQECSVIPESYPDRKYRARVRELAPEANRQKATIQVKVAVIDPDSYLRPETNAKVNFLEEGSAVQAGARDRVLVPKGAILSGPAVFLLRDQKAARIPIALGAERNGRVEVLSGLGGGERIIVGGLDGLVDGMAVTLKK